MTDQILVAAWNWLVSSTVTWDVDSRLGGLADAVKATQAVLNDKASRGEVGAIGLIRAVFVAPEYFFAAPLSGSSPTGRGVDATAFEKIRTKLKELSTAHPRILIVPGTIAWRSQLDVQQMTAQAKSYLRICERLMNASDKAGRAKLIGDICKNVRIDSNEILSNVSQALPNTQILTESTVVKWWKDDPYMWAWAINAIAGTLSNGGRTVYGHVTDFANELYKVKTQLGGSAWALRNTAFAYLNGVERYRYDKRGNFHEEVNYGPDTVFIRGESSGVSEIEGLKVGFEICLDHAINALPELVRENAKGRLDLHIVASDYVINRVTPDQLIREGGHKIHAATVDTEHGVWQKVGGHLVAVPSLGHHDIWGRRLTYWAIAVEDDASLADSFMSEDGLADFIRLNAPPMVPPRAVVPSRPRSNTI